MELPRFSESTTVSVDIDEPHNFTLCCGGAEGRGEHADEVKGQLWLLGSRWVVKCWLRDWSSSRWRKWFGELLYQSAKSIVSYAENKGCSHVNGKWTEAKLEHNQCLYCIELCIEMTMKPWRKYSYLITEWCLYSVQLKAERAASGPWASVCTTDEWRGCWEVRILEVFLWFHLVFTQKLTFSLNMQKCPLRWILFSFSFLLFLTLSGWTHVNARKQWIVKCLKHWCHTFH